MTVRMFFTVALFLPALASAEEPEFTISSPHPCVQFSDVFFVSDEGLRGFSVSDELADEVIARWPERFFVLFDHFPEAERREKMRAVVQAKDPSGDYPEDLRPRLNVARKHSCYLLTGLRYYGGEGL